jgi:DNA modification methylase
MTNPVIIGDATLYCADSRDVIASMPDCCIDACVTDPPYALTSTIKRWANTPRTEATMPKVPVYARATAGFMGQKWDTGDTAFDPEFWADVLRVLRPGAHLLAFGGTRTYHRLACAIEDAGFEVRDAVMWHYGSGFPKSHDVSKGIDKKAGAERKIIRERYTAKRIKPGATVVREGGYGKQDVTFTACDTAPATDAAAQWQGWGTALKPATEIICLARKPLIGTVAANVLQHGTGAINVDACRVATGDDLNGGKTNPKYVGCNDGWRRPFQDDAAYMAERAGLEQQKVAKAESLGRWPANVVHDGSEEVLAAFPDVGLSTGGQASLGAFRNGAIYGVGRDEREKRDPGFGDSGSAARFFKSCPITVEDIAWNPEPASFAVECSNLQSEAAVSVLSHAVAASMPGSALIRPGYRAPSTSATASEFETLCEIVIATIQSIARRFSPESKPQSITARVNLARGAATPGPTGTMTITASHWRSDGSAEPVTFSITLPSAEVGAKDLNGGRRFHYSAKADAQDRLGSKHPTVKPIDLMAYLCRLITPPGGTVLDPFAGSGTTGMAAIREGFKPVLIEREAEYFADACNRIRHIDGSDTPLFAQAPA